MFTRTQLYVCCWSTAAIFIVLGAMANHLAPIMLFAVLAFFAGLIFSPNRSTKPVSVVFTPEASGIETFLVQMKLVKKSFHAAVFAWTDAKATAAVIDLHLRRITVSLVLDAEQAMSSAAAVEQLAALLRAGVNVRLASKCHHKFAVLDEDVVLTGSWNVSQNANMQFNALNIIELTEVARTYLKHYRGLFVRSRQQNLEVVERRLDEVQSSST